MYHSNQQHNTRSIVFDRSDILTVNVKQTITDFLISVDGNRDCLFVEICRKSSHIRI
jgi:hypothetical protein